VAPGSTATDEFKNSVDKAKAEFGALDILVNNAGVNGAHQPVVDMSIEAFEKTIRTNLFAPFYLCRLFARHRKTVGARL
jgi:glucose 1-dehydrogenase